MTGIGKTQFYKNLLKEGFREHCRIPLKPKQKQHHVGIEIECYSKLVDDEVFALLLRYELDKNVNITDDGSIDPPDGYCSYELRILGKEKELPKLFTKLGKFLKAGGFKVNKSCGLHVHLDMRNRQLDDCYDKLLKFQAVMFGMVSPSRQDSDYCKWTYHGNEYDRFVAINKTAYSKHKTIEIRLHQGTTNVIKIKNWVNLLLKAIASPELPTFKTKEDVVKWTGRSKTLKSYIKERLQSSFVQFDSPSFLDDYDGEGRD